MKIQDLPIKNLIDLKENENSYLIANEIHKKEDSDTIDNINKILIPLQSLATKEEINSVVEQNSQLVQVVNKLLAKYQESERVIIELKNQIKERYETPDISDIQAQIESLNERLDNSLIEY